MADSVESALRFKYCHADARAPMPRPLRFRRSSRHPCRHHLTYGVEVVPSTVVDLSNAFPDGRPCVVRANDSPNPRIFIGRRQTDGNYHPNVARWEVDWEEFIDETQRQHLEVVRDRNGYAHVRYDPVGRKVVEAQERQERLLRERV